MDNQNRMAVFHLIRQAYKDWCRPLCQELGMPQMAFDILMFISENPELCTAKDIDLHQGFKKNILSVNVNKLVSEGYLERQSVEGDRRKVHLALTEKATPIITRGKRAQEEFNLLIQDGIAPEELDIFAKCLCIAGENAQKLRATKSFQESPDEEHI